MEQLSSSGWSSELLQSSKTIGRGRPTAREKIRQAYLEDKAGVKDIADNEDVRLFVEKEEADPEILRKELEAQAKATAAAEAEKAAASTASAVGSALIQSDTPAMPMTKRKRKKKSLIPAAARKRFKQRKGIESDSSFDSSDSEYDSDSGDEKPRESVAALLEPENIDGQPTALEEVVEAAKNVPKPELRREETDEIKVKLLKSLNEGDLSNDVAKTFNVPVNRLASVQEARSKLPVCSEEQVIMEAIRNNTVVIICGETGSGKTTQVPQFLYEAGWSHPDSDNPGLIGITQPRRVAAVSMAKRVAHELNRPEGEVSYQIRYDATTSSKTRLKFMTDGVLLRELSQDLLLTKYSVLIIDEAHERNLNTDILIGVVSRVLRLRAELSREDREKIKPLRVVIMSATLRVSDFTENKTLFDKPPPVINVDARQFPVSVHFNKRTPEDYVGEAFKKISKIHERLPTGGILVFLTGQNEITHLCKLLRQKYPSLPPKATQTEKVQEDKANELETHTEDLPNGQADVENEDVDLGENDDLAEEDFNLESEGDDTDIEEGFDEEELGSVQDAPLHVLPLYSMLPTEAQLRVFQPPPEGTRLCVIATNVAETSVTIPGIRYVIDCGKVKDRKFTVETGIQSFEINWTSKASADQRAGRAGRTQAGHCYRLFSSAVFDHEFEKFSLPEIKRMPLEGVVLNMKSMNIDQVVNFPFPTPPPRESLYKAEKLLQYLGGVDKMTKHITDFGEAMSLFPVTPRLAKMLIIGQQHGCLPYVIIMVSALSVGNPFDPNEGQHQKHIMTFVSEASDILTLVTTVGAYEYADASDSFCREHGLRQKAMTEIRQLRRQLTNIVASNFPGVDICVDPKLRPPNKKQLKILQQILTAGFIDSIAVRADVLEAGGGKGARHKNASGVAYKLMWSNEDAFIHPTSVLYVQEPPVMVAYSELTQTPNNTWMKNVTAVEAKWLCNLGKELCTYGRPLNYPLPK
ncbi:P-loop containing nucleoside triphosphate hydrolase protein [Zychaea mexicana]|uniref:P-loop containing nucleoside triphosphate hydrolase protein n=1 Tax=Zychaea mexicana TaxID=64656 RepID=UPI0022FF2120|nr:P-loop containing nucleoside triphosphate hydrolase protein [Zychaea mexicana]KAI9498059.1 P-loop containing nucleoside triphosphate hydrolase protein [Zychaea mexicana]